MVLQILSSLSRSEVYKPRSVCTVKCPMGWALPPLTEPVKGSRYQYQSRFNTSLVYSCVNGTWESEEADRILTSLLAQSYMMGPIAMIIANGDELTSMPSNPDVRCLPKDSLELRDTSIMMRKFFKNKDKLSKQNE